MTVDEILRAAMALSDTERTQLAGRLLESVDAEVSEEEAQRLWAVEIERRVRENEELGDDQEDYDAFEVLEELRQQLER